MGASSGAATAASMAMSIYNAKQQSDAIKMQGEFDAQQAKFNVQSLEVRKNELLAKAEEDQTDMAKQVQQMLGIQKVSLAAQGIEVDTGTAEQIQAETKEIGRKDIMRIKNNAWREAWGMEVQQEQIETQAKFAKLGARTQASNTLATGGLQALNTGLSYMRDR